jgi:hypothetical protein
MQTRNALDIALQLYRQPALAHKVRRDGLPSRVLSVIKIAAGSEEEIETPFEHTPEELQEIREAAIFFLQNCLFQSGDNSYRVLGVRPDAAISEMLVHKRWLLKWLHPDVNRNKWEAVYLQRVLTAWEEVTRSVSTRETAPPSEGLMQAPRKRAWRYRRHRFASHNTMPLRHGRIFRQGAIVLGLSFVVFLAFRQPGGFALTNMIHFLGPLGQKQW